MVKKTSKCPTCGKSSSIREEDKHPIFKKMEAVLKSRKSPYEKKIALYKCLKGIEVGELEQIEKERIDYLLQGKLYNELAKQCMKDYRRLTVKDFNKEK